MILDYLGGPQNAITYILRRQAHGREDRQRKQNVDGRKRCGHKSENPNRPQKLGETRKAFSSEPRKGVRPCQQLHFSSKKLSSDSGFQNCRRINFCQRINFFSHSAKVICYSNDRELIQQIGYNFKNKYLSTLMKSTDSNKQTNKKLKQSIEFSKYQSHNSILTLEPWARVSSVAIQWPSREMLQSLEAPQSTSTDSEQLI